MIIRQIEIAKIKTSDRARTNFGEVGELAEDIKKHGLLQPIVINSDYTLLAGERRLRACTLLKWESIPCNYLSDLPLLTQLKIQYSENHNRKNFAWVEEVKLLEQIYNLEKEANPDFKYTEFVSSENKGRQGAKDLFLAKAIRKYPDLIKEKDKSNALRTAERREQKEVRKLIAQVGTLEADLGLVQDVPFVKTKSIQLYNQDCIEGMEDLSDNSVDMILTDIPYGVNHDEWDPSNDIDFRNLILPAFKEMYRVLKTGGHIYIFHASLKQDLTKFLLILASFSISNIPLIWYKGVGAGHTNSPYSQYRPNYEPVFFGWKGTPKKLIHTGDSVLFFDAIPTANKIHKTEKPTILLSYLISQSSVEGELILDPFAGSGSTLEACTQSGRRGIGFELDEDIYIRAKYRLEGENI